jgi:hypothetical protein
MQNMMMRVESKACIWIKHGSNHEFTICKQLLIVVKAELGSIPGLELAMSWEQMHA